MSIDQRLHYSFLWLFFSINLFALKPNNEFIAHLDSLEKNGTVIEYADYIVNHINELDKYIEEPDSLYLEKIYYCVVAQSILRDVRDNVKLKTLFEENVIPIQDSVVKYNPLYLFYSYVYALPAYSTDNLPKINELSEKAISYLDISGGTGGDSIFYFNEVGKAYLNFGAYDRAISFYSQAEKMVNSKSINENEFASTFSGMARIYEIKDDIENALVYHNKCVDIRKKSGLQNPEIAKAISNIATVYLRIGDYKKAEDYFIEAYTILKSQKSISKDEGLYARHVGIALLNQEKIIEAKTYLHVADSIEQILLTPNDLIRSKTNNQLAKAYVLLKDFERAKHHLGIAIDVLTSQPISDSYQYDLLSVRAVLANLEYESGAFESAINTTSITLEDIGKKDIYYSERLNLEYIEAKSLYKIGKKDEAMNIGERLIEDLSSDESKALTGDLKLRVFLWLSNNMHSEKNENQLKKKLAFLESAMDELVILFARQSYWEDQMKTASTHFHIYGDAIKVAQELYNVNRDPVYVEHIDRIISQSKDKQLWINFRNKESANDLELSAIERDSIDQMEILLAYWKDQRDATLNKKLKADYNKKIVETQIELSSLIPGFRSQDIRLFSPEDLEPVVSNSSKDMNTLVLNYVLIDSTLYTTGRTGRDLFFQSVPFTGEKVQMVQALIASLQSPANEFDSKLAENVSNIVIPDFMSNLDVDELIIKSHGVLSFLPFDILYRDDKYLIEDYLISYNIGEAESGSKNTSFTEEYFGVAPVYNNFPKLSFAKAEIKKGNEIFNVTQDLDNGIEKESLVRMLRQSSIVHIAGHALMDDSTPFDSRIIISDIDTTIAFSLREIASVEAYTDLVILSACNTGSGYLYKSEGVSSLSKSFSMAGVGSVLASLWNTNDYSSNFINEQFLTDLKNGKNKVAALRNAKLKYLKEAVLEEQKHPYYWSNFVLHGNTGPVTFNSFSIQKMAIGGLLVAAFLASLFFYNNKISS